MKIDFIDKERVREAVESCWELFGGPYHNVPHQDRFNHCDEYLVNYFEKHEFSFDEKFLTIKNVAKELLYIDINTPVVTFAIVSLCTAFPRFYSTNSEYLENPLIVLGDNKCL